MNSPEPGQKDASQFAPEHIEGLAHSDSEQRVRAARNTFTAGIERVRDTIASWEQDREFRALVVREQHHHPAFAARLHPKLTVGIAVRPETFEKIRQANGPSPLADAPADMDVMEFELEFPESGPPIPRIDVLTTKTPGGTGAIARFLEKFGEGIQQVEVDVSDVDRATEILRTHFKTEPVYPGTRPGANNTRVNFFLVTATDNRKVLVELVEQPKTHSHISVHQQK